MGNPITVNLSEIDGAGTQGVPLDQLEPVPQKTPQKPPPVSFDSLYSQPATPKRPTNPFGIQSMPPAPLPAPTQAASRVTEPQINLAPPEHPQPQSDYWTQEYAARERDIARINASEQSRQQHAQQDQERQAEIAKQPFDTRLVQSMMEPGTTLGTVLRQQAPQEPAPQFESDYFKHRAAEAQPQGKSAWDALPHSFTEAAVRTANINMRPDQARQIAEPFTQPLLDVPTVTGHTQPVAAGAERAIGGFTSPENMAMLGSLGALETAAQSSSGLLRHAPRVVSGLFTTQMGTAAREYQRAKAAGDTQAAQRILGSALVQAPLTLLTAYHASAGRAGAPLRAEELLDTIHAADTSASISKAEAIQPRGEADTTSAIPVSVPLEDLTPSKTAQTVRPPEAVQADLDDLQPAPNETRSQTPEPSGFGRQQAQSYVNRVRDIYTREYAQSYLKSSLEGSVEPERGNLGPLDAAAIRRSIDDRLARQKPIPVAQKYSPDVLEEAHAELRAANDLASSFEKPGRYLAGAESGDVLRGQEKTHGGTWYGVTSSRDMVAQQFPWYSDESITPAKLQDALQRGKGANYERVVDRIADHLQAQREEAGPVIEEFKPQLESLAGQVRDVDPELSQTLLDIRDGRYASIRNLPTFIEGKVADAQRAAQFSQAFDELSSAEAGHGLPESAEEGFEPHGGSREASSGEEETHGQLAAHRVPLEELTPATASVPPTEQRVTKSERAQNTYTQPARTVERDYDDAGRHFGLEYRGVMGADLNLGDKAVVIYQDPKSKTSIGVKVGEWSPERVQEKLQEARTRMGGGESLYAGLGFLDPELIRRVMPESIKNALGENISIGEREAGIIREKTGELARKKEQVFQKYADAMARWDKRPVQDGRDFILREQHGENQPNAADQDISHQLQKEFATRRQAIENLSHGSFDHWKEHYFPQMWERPTQIANWVVKQIMGGKRPLQGPAGFRKARVFEDIQEGLDAGFKPVTNNPVTMALLKLHEMDRYTMAHEILGTMKEESLAKAVMVGDHAPEGWTRISDGISTIYGDRNIPIKEYYDEAVLNKLSETAKKLGIEHERAVRIGGSRLGYTSEGSNRIVTRFATPEAVIAHEIGHQLDWKYGLRDQLVKDPRYKQELRNLVDLKWEGKEEQNVPESFRKYIRKGEEKMATIVEALVQAPDKFREVAPNAWSFIQKLIANNPELKPLLEAKPSLVYGQRQDTVSAGGMVIRGYYYAPAEATRVLNNYLAPGLRGNPLYDAFRGAGNTLNQAQLGFSAFHAMFSAINSSISDAALALRKASSLDIRDVLEVAKAGGRAATLVASPLRHVIEGTKLMHEYLSPGSYEKYSELANAVAKGGGRVYQDPLYRNAAISKFWKAWGEGDWKRVGLQAFPATLEKMAQPVMEYLVPRLKLGAFSDIARESLDRLPPGAGKEQIRSALDKAWDSVDNRFGQVVYDNLFVNKALKDLGLVGVRSLGWNLGTVRELGGAAVDTAKAAGRAATGQRPRFTDRMAYTMALPVVTGYIGAIVNFAYTGQGPQELKDYFFPRTGRTLPNGEPERISIPTYMKDVYAFSKHPLVTASHKVHPLIAMIADMLRNQDFYGVEIRHADDPLVKQAGQLASYVAEQFSPLSYRNLTQRARAEGKPGIKGALSEALSPAGLQSFVGITPAPSSVTHTAAEEKAIEILNNRRPQGTKTSEEFEHSQQHAYLRGEVAAGRMNPADLSRRVQSGELSPKEAGSILKQSREAPIVRYTRSLPLEDFLTVWDLANQRERDQLRPILLAKRALVANLPASERVPMAQRVSKAINGTRQ